MGINYQEHRAYVDLAKAFRQLQKADAAFADSNDDSAIKHLSNGLDDLQKSFDHLGKAADDIVNKAAAQIGKGNDELQKSIDAYTDGNDDNADKHYARALDHYDQAFEILR